MMKKTFLLMLSAAVMALSAHAFPPRPQAREAGVRRLSLPECQRMARAGNLSLKAARADVERARILQGTAWDPGQAELALSQDPTSGGSPDNALTLSQAIDFPTRYMARRRQLRAEADLRQAEAEAAANRLGGQVAALYYTLVYQRQKLRILQRQDSLLGRYGDVAAKRHAAGEARQLEPLNASRMLHENRLEMALAAAGCANTQAELARLLGTTERVEPADTALAPVAFPKGAPFDFGLTPEGRLAESRVSVADHAVRVEKSAYAPSLSLALRTQMVIKGWNPYHVDRGWNDGNFMGFEVGVGLPIFTGATRARVRAAKKERELLQLQGQDEAALRLTAHAAAGNRMAAAKARLDYFASRGLSEAERAADISARAYESGEIGYIEHVAALQQVIDTQLKYAAAIHDYNQAAIDLLTLEGTPPGS